MTVRLFSLIILLQIALAFAPGLQAGEEETPLSDEQVRAQVAAWLEDLRSPEFAVREAAREGLSRHGARARALLEARRDDPDLEVQRTVRLLLDSFGRPVEVPTAPPADLTALGIVTLDAQGELPFLLEALGRKHGATFALPADLGEARGAVAQTDAPFFAVLETLARAHGLSATAAFDAGGHLALTNAVEGEEAPWAAAGPLRARVVEVTSVRTLRSGSGTGRRYVIALDLHWIPSVQLVTWRTPTDLVAADGEGRAFKVGGNMRANTTWGVSTSARTARLQIHLEPDDLEAAEKLATLSFKLPICLRHDRQEVRFPDLTDIELPTDLEVANEDAPATTVPDRITLRAVGQPDGEQGPWIVDIAAHLVGEPAPKSLAVVLERADGTSQAASVGSRFPSADGTLGLTARAYGRWEKPPVAARVSWYRVQEEGTLAFELMDVPLR